MTIKPEIKKNNSDIPTNEEAELAASLLQKLEEARESCGSLVLNDNSEKKIFIPNSIVDLISDLLGYLARKELVFFASFGDSISIREAEIISKFSRQYLRKLLNDGKIDQDQSGDGNNIKLESLLKFLEKIKEKRADTIDFMANSCQESETL